MNRRTLLAASASGAALPGLARTPGLAARASARQAQAATPCPPATPAANTATARHFFDEAINGRDLASLDDFTTPDVVHHAATVGSTTGRAGLKATYEILLGGFSDVRFDVVASVAEGDRVAFAYVGTGTQDGPFLGLPPSGRKLDDSGTYLMRLDCGRIAEIWSVLDQLERLRDLGVIAGTPEGLAAEPGDVMAATPTPCAPADRGAVEAAVRTHWDRGWNHGDADALAAVTTDDVRYRRAGASDLHGRAALLAWIGDRRAAMPDHTVRYDPVIVEGEMAAARWTASGTDTGGVLGHPPTGKHAEWGGLTLFRTACGRIEEAWSEEDLVGMLKQLGLPLGPPGPRATPSA